jgi:hypothetical protein
MLRSGALKKNTRINTIGTSSRKMLSRPMTRQARSLELAASAGRLG